jgi:polyisoprenyl-phosphate glycosyltransferase
MSAPMDVPNSSGRPTLTIVAPCYNEAAGIETFHRQVRDVLDGIPRLTGRIVFVDDGSTDGTLEKLNAIAMRDPSVDVYSLSRNFGHQVALTAGLDVARGDAVLMMDSDLQHPPSLIPELVRRWQSGFDVVSTVRHTTSGASVVKRAGAAAFYWLINRLSDVEIVPGAADFCLLSRRAHEALLAMPEHHRFLRGMVAWVGFPRALVPFDAPARPAGASKYTLLKMMGFAIDALLSFSAAPMRIATRMGTLLVLPGLAYLVYVFYRYFSGDTVPGWGSIVSVLLIVGGTQLVFIGLIGEYLSKIFEETKHRPLYVLKQRPPAAVAGSGERPWAAVHTSRSSQM